MDLVRSGLTALATTANCLPNSLALDTARQRVYFSAGSAAQATNFIQRIDYDGLGLTHIVYGFRKCAACTALDLDLANAVIIYPMPGRTPSQRISLSGDSATSVFQPAHNGRRGALVWQANLSSTPVSPASTSPAKVVFSATMDLSGCLFRLHH